MSLYYEDFPADDGAEPQLPPLLTAVKVPSGQNVMAKALASGATAEVGTVFYGCLLYTSPSPRDYAASRMPSSA